MYLPLGPLLLSTNGSSEAFASDTVLVKYDSTLNKIVAVDWQNVEVPFSATVSGDLVATGSGGFSGTLNADSLTADRALALPNVAGTFRVDTTVTTSASAMVFAPARYADQTFAYTGAGTLATGSVTLPTAANSRVGQVVKIFTHGIVTSFTATVSGSGTILGTALTAMTAENTYEWTCISTASTGTWARTK
jgi:hypothetical protein